MVRFLAHAEELHESQSQALIHYLDNPWLAFMLWLVLLTLIFIIVRFVLKRGLASFLLPAAIVQLIYGFILYSESPAIGALVVSAGFAMTLFMVIIGLQQPAVKKKGKKKGKK